MPHTKDVIPERELSAQPRSQLLEMISHPFWPEELPNVFKPCLAHDPSGETDPFRIRPIHQEVVDLSNGQQTVPTEIENRVWFERRLHCRYPASNPPFGQAARGTDSDRFLHSHTQLPPLIPWQHRGSLV